MINWPRLYDRATGTYLEGWPEVWAAREAAEAQVAVEQAGRLAAEARIRQLEGGATPAASGPLTSCCEALRPGSAGEAIRGVNQLHGA